MGLQELIELVKEVENQDSIDWGMLNIDENEAIKLIAMDVLDMFKGYETCSEREAIMLVTITKLILENFVLQLKIHGNQ